MTLEKQLAQTFRAARWAESDGKPTCHQCFDGLDLGTPKPDTRVLGLSRYRCRACYVEFSDVTRTPFAVVKPITITLWAYLVLHGDPRLLNWPERDIQHCFDRVARIKGEPLPAAWRTQLDAAKITVARLRRALARRPEAA